jgi:putative transposase
MPRPPRADEAGGIYHALNRGNARREIFHKAEDYFPIACRYAERNALAAGLVVRAEDWRWGSLWSWCGGLSIVKLSPWPVPRLPGWVRHVNAALTDAEHKQVRRSLDRSRPFGAEDWVQSLAPRLKLESTLRPRGRPRRFA